MKTFNVAACVVALIEAEDEDQAERELLSVLREASTLARQHGITPDFDHYEGPVTSVRGVEAFESEPLT